MALADFLSAIDDARRWVCREVARLLWTNDGHPTWTYNAQAVELAVRKLPIMVVIGACKYLLMERQFDHLYGLRVIRRGGERSPFW